MFAFSYYVRNGARNVLEPRTARAIAHLIAKGTSREAADTPEALIRLPYSRSSFERAGHAVGALLVEVRDRVEKTLIEAYAVPERARSISVSLDRVSVPSSGTSSTST